MHCVGFPTACKFDSNGVDSGTEEGHGATRSKSASTDLFGRDAGGVVTGGRCLAQPGGNIRSCDSKAVILVVVRSKDSSFIERELAGGEVSAVSEDTPYCALHRAAEWIATAAMGNGISLSLIFLCGEIEADGCGSFNFAVWGLREIELASTDV